MTVTWTFNLFFCSISSAFSELSFESPGSLSFLFSIPVLPNLHLIILLRNNLYFSSHFPSYFSHSPIKSLSENHHILCHSKPSSTGTSCTMTPQFQSLNELAFFSVLLPRNCLGDSTHKQLLTNYVNPQYQTLNNMLLYICIVFVLCEHVSTDKCSFL